MKLDFQIAQILWHADHNLKLVQILYDHPKKTGQNYSPGNARDDFYKHIANMLFNEALLDIASLLDTDVRGIRIAQLPNQNRDFRSKITKARKNFKSTYLLTMRKQIIAHRDLGNRNNNFPINSYALIADPIFKALSKITQEMKEAFIEYQSVRNISYSDEYMSFTQSVNNLETLLSNHPPTLTRSPII